MKPLTLALAAASVVMLFVSLTGCQTRAQEGALLGGALGAGTGAIIGSTTGHAAGGALIGGAVGAFSGAIIGDQLDQANKRPAAPAPSNTTRGHYENRIVRTPSGETYEERVWVPDR